MHKKVQSLLITGVLSANMVGSTISVFADDTSKKENTKVEQAAKPSEETINWQQTTDENYTQLWNFQENNDVIILTKYKDDSKNQNIEIPTKIKGKKVELENLNKEVFPKAERIKVAASTTGTDKVKVKATSLENAFLDNETLKSVDLRGIDVSEVTDLSGFFANTINLENVNLAGWNVSNVEDLSGFLANNVRLQSVNLTGWEKTEKLTNTKYMFYGCSNLNSIDLTDLNMNNVTDAESMFQNCDSLTSIKGTENWTLENIQKISSIFAGTRLNFINLSKSKLPYTLMSSSIKNMFGNPSGNAKKILVLTNDRMLKVYKYDLDTREKFKLTFNADLGTFKDGLQTQTLDSFTITPDEVELLTTPTKTGYTFGGWQKVNDNELKAIWKNSSEQKPTDKPENSLQQFIQILDQSVVNILHQGQGTENDPLILEAKNITKTALTDYLDTLNALSEMNSLKANVSAINRYSAYTEYKITIESKNIKKATNNQAINVTLRISNDKADLVKEANRYSKKLNSEIKIPIIATFSDVTNDFWGKASIEEFASMGIVHGYPDGQFKPNNSITRAEFVKILNNTFGFNKQASTVKFNDVSKDSWYYNDIAIAIDKGYINGRSATTFAPDDNITREEVAMMLTNIMKNKANKLDKLNEFNDGNQTSDWAKSAMAGAIEAGYFIGDGQKNLNPTKNMTRAEAVSSLSRIKAK